MENKEQQILSEIKAMMASVRSQLELLDAKMAELQQAVGQEDGEMVPIDLELDDIQYDATVEMPADDPAETSVDIPVETPVETPVEIPVEAPVEDEPDDDLPFYDLPAEPVEEPVEETVEEPVEEVVEEVAEEPVVQDDDDLPIFAEPEPEPVAVPEEPVVDQKTRPAVIDSMIDRQAWRTDMPGTQVKDIRSAISLNDRILFINMLFNQDPMAFQDALTKINQMAALDEAVNYIVDEHPDWDMESETVYRFMMAVRRKIR